MPLSKYERKEKLPYGAQIEIATELDLSETTVSWVQNDHPKMLFLSPETIARVREAIAKRIRCDDGSVGMPVSEVFALPNEVGSVT